MLPIVFSNFEYRIEYKRQSSSLGDFIDVWHHTVVPQQRLILEMAGNIDDLAGKFFFFDIVLPSGLDIVIGNWTKINGVWELRSGVRICIVREPLMELL